MFEVVLFSKPAKFYNKLDDKTAKRLNKGMETLKSKPFMGKNIKKLSGKLAGKYRLRVGEIRVVYFVEGQRVIIETIGYRAGVYWGRK